MKVHLFPQSSRGGWGLVRPALIIDSCLAGSRLAGRKHILDWQGEDSETVCNRCSFCRVMKCALYEESRKGQNKKIKILNYGLP